MFETLDTMISLGVIFLILSMVHKYVMSMVKRFFKIKGKVVAEEMKTFVGENTIKYMIPFLEKNAKYQNVLDIIKGKNALRELSEEQLRGIVSDLKKFLENEENFEEIKKLVPDVNSGNIKTEVDKIKTHLEVLENKITSMFDNTMKKISEVYETKLRYRTFYCGMILAFVINADFFDIYNSISKDSIVRDKIVAKATFIKDEMNSLSKKIEANDGKEIEKIAEELEGARTEVENLTKKIEDAGLQLGWTKDKISGACNDIGSLLLKLIGMVIAGLLISFGAPFWHNFIETFAGIKSTLKAKGEKTGDG